MYITLPAAKGSSGNGSIHLYTRSRSRVTMIKDATQYEYNAKAVKPR